MKRKPRMFNGHSFYATKDGYYKSDTYGLMHRYIWEQHNQCKIPEGYVVHHKDHNKENNDPSNLVIMTNKDHAIHHRRGVKIPKLSEVKKGKPLSELNVKMMAIGRTRKITQEMMDDSNILTFQEFMKKHSCSTAIVYRAKRLSKGESSGLKYS